MSGRPWVDHLAIWCGCGCGCVRWRLAERDELREGGAKTKEGEMKVKGEKGGELDLGI